MRYSTILFVLCLLIPCYADFPSRLDVASDIGHLCLGMPIADARKILFNRRESDLVRSDDYWSFKKLEKPILAGLREVRFVNGRVAELSGESLGLANFSERIQKGKPFSTLLEHGLPKPTDVQGDLLNGVVQWSLTEQVFAVRMKDELQAADVERGPQILRIRIQDGLVDYITLLDPRL